MRARKKKPTIAPADRLVLLPLDTVEEAGRVLRSLAIVKLRIKPVLPAIRCRRVAVPPGELESNARAEVADFKSTPEEGKPPCSMADIFTRKPSVMEWLHRTRGPCGSPCRKRWEEEDKEEEEDSSDEVHVEESTRESGLRKAASSRRPGSIPVQFIAKGPFRGSLGEKSSKL